MPIRTFDTPEAAALDGFPGAHCRVAAALAEGDDAYVVLDTGPAGRPYLYGAALTRRDGGWTEVASGNGPGWTRTDPDGDLGTAVAWGESPEGADRVRARFGGEVREAPVVDGVYLVAWWRVPSPGDVPSPTAFRVQDRWIADGSTG